MKLLIRRTRGALTKAQKPQTKSFLINSPEEMRILGRKTANCQLLKRQGEKAIVFGLQGNLAGGKTTFLQGFAGGLRIRQKVLSPTFVILKKFKIPKTSLPLPFSSFYHIDCYRIKTPRDILNLGFEQIVDSPKNIVCVEHADRIKKIMPSNTIWVKFTFLGKEKRKVAFSLPPSLSL